MTERKTARRVGSNFCLLTKEEYEEMSIVEGSLLEHMGEILGISKDPELADAPENHVHVMLPGIEEAKEEWRQHVRDQITTVKRDVQNTIHAQDGSFKPALAGVGALMQEELGMAQTAEPVLPPTHISQEFQTGPSRSTDPLTTEFINLDEFSRRARPRMSSPNGMLGALKPFH